jgi:hypothetical protein
LSAERGSRIIALLVGFLLLAAADIVAVEVMKGGRGLWCVLNSAVKEEPIRGL